MKLSLQRKRPALSEIVSTILIIAIALVAIGILYAFFTSTTSRAQNTTTFRVTGQLIASGSSPPTLTLTVTNTGSIAIQSINVIGNIVSGTTFSWTTTPSTNSLIQPGLSAGATVPLTATSVTSGNTYTITIQATFVNGAVVTQLLQLTAQ